MYTGHTGYIIRAATGRDAVGAFIDRYVSDSAERLIANRRQSSKSSPTKPAISALSKLSVKKHLVLVKKKKQQQRSWGNKPLTHKQTVVAEWGMHTTGAYITMHACAVYRNDLYWSSFLRRGVSVTYVGVRGNCPPSVCRRAAFAYVYNLHPPSYFLSAGTGTLLGSLNILRRTSTYIYICNLPTATQTSKQVSSDEASLSLCVVCIHLCLHSKHLYVYMYAIGRTKQFFCASFLFVFTW